jgi:hypothetical protein
MGSGGGTPAGHRGRLSVKLVLGVFALVSCLMRNPRIPLFIGKCRALPFGSQLRACPAHLISPSSLLPLLPFFFLLHPSSHPITHSYSITLTQSLPHPTLQSINMPAQEVNQPQVQQMDIPQADAQQPVRCSLVVVVDINQTSPTTTPLPSINLSLYPYLYPSPIFNLTSLTPSQKPAEQMTAEPVSMRGGGEGGEVCCGM